MRTAILSDVHGNRFALEAVLADAATLGVEEWWVLGDHCAIGPEPALVIERLAGLANARFTRGNTDRYVLTDETPSRDLEAVRERPDRIPSLVRIATSLAWTKGFVTATGWMRWLEDLPLELRHMLPNGIRILGVHASPGNDDGEGVHPGSSNAELRAYIDGAAADVLIVGHTHEPMVRRVDHALVVNLGSVSNPKAPDLRASYVIMEPTDTGLRLMHRRVAYDAAGFVEVVLRARHPAERFILSHQRGERLGRPPHQDHVPVVTGEWVAYARG